MPQLQRRSFLAIWLRFAADCLYLAVYFATKFFLDVTEGVSISSALAFQFLIAAALVASAVLISPTAAGSSLSKGIARKCEMRGRIGCTCAYWLYLYPSIVAKTLKTCIADRFVTVQYREEPST